MHKPSSTTTLDPSTKIHIIKGAHPWKLQIMMNFLILIVHHEILDPKLITCRLQSLLDEKKRKKKLRYVTYVSWMWKTIFSFNNSKLMKWWCTPIYCVVTGAYYIIHEGLCCKTNEHNTLLCTSQVRRFEINVQGNRNLIANMTRMYKIKSLLELYSFFGYFQILYECDCGCWVLQLVLVWDYSH